MHLHRPPRLHAAMADELSQELIAEFSQGFKYFDRDEDGRVSTNQLGTLMRSLGQNPTEAELQEMVNGFDLEGKGTMDLEEFLALMVKQRARMATERQLIEMFEVCVGFRAGGFVQGIAGDGPNSAAEAAGGPRRIPGAAGAHGAHGTAHWVAASQIRCWSSTYPPEPM